MPIITTSKKAQVSYSRYFINSKYILVSAARKIMTLNYINFLFASGWADRNTPYSI
jgi:hypothetical protein